LFVRTSHRDMIPGGTGERVARAAGGSYTSQKWNERRGIPAQIQF